MLYLKRSTVWAALIGLATVNGAFGQISAINSVVYSLRQNNDIPNATLTVVSNYPSFISIEYQNVSTTNHVFADRTSWHFSKDGGKTPFLFSNSDSFTITMQVTLTGNPISPRKEAGIVFNNPLNDGGEFIVNTDSHEFVAFGGFLRFWSFSATNSAFRFNSGETITMGLTVFRDSHGSNAIIYYASSPTACMVSPVLEFDNLEKGVINGTTIGGYIQVVNAPTNANNMGTAVFENIHIGLPDQDFDGVPDAFDLCPNTTPPCTLVDAQGCSLDQLAPCAGPPTGGTWKNHGEYVSTLAQAVNEFVEQGLITESEGEAIVSAGAQSSCGKK